jgi:putative membrane protein
MITVTTTVLGSLTGCALALPLALLPGMHVYNLLAILVLTMHALGRAGDPGLTAYAIPVTTAMLTTYVFVSAIPTIFLATPDDSALFLVRPGQAALRRGRGVEGVMLTSLGTAAGLILTLAAGTLLMPRLLPTLYQVLRPHTHWILWCIILLMLQSEWPRTHLGRRPGWRWFCLANRSCLAGVLTFLLAGGLGMLIMWSRLLPPRCAFQGLLPAFLGLFTLPQLILDLAAHSPAPTQSRECDPVRLPELAHGTLAGLLGGGLAAFLPVVTGGVGGWLAGHATAMRNNRAFLISQGTTRAVYYVGALLLFVTPPLHLVRGGAAWMLQAFVAPTNRTALYQATAAAGLAGVVSILLLTPLTAGAAALLVRVGHRPLGLLTLVLCTLLTATVTGLPGLGILAVATAIGLIPLLYESRRMNALGVIMLPIACSMSGLAPTITRWLGLA